MKATATCFPAAATQPTPAELANLKALKNAWLDSDGTSKPAAKAFNDALRVFGESDAYGFYFVME